MLGLAETWHCPPSVVLKEEARWIRAADVRRRGHPEQEGGEQG